MSTNERIERQKMTGDRVSDRRRGGVVALVSMALLASSCGLPGGGDGNEASALDVPPTTLVSGTPSTDGVASAVVAGEGSESGDAEGEAETSAVAAVAQSSGGASAVLKRVEFTVGRSMIVDDVLTVGLGVETLEPTAWTLGSLGLLDANGRRVGVGTIADDLGEPLRSVDFGGRDAHRIQVSFRLTDLPAGERPVDLVGWAIEITHDDDVPLVLPLEGAGFATRYPLPLAHGEEASVSSGTFGGCAEPIEMSTIVDRATVSLERSDERASRVSSGDRVVQIQLALTNPSDDRGNCKQLVLWPSFDLDADGVTIPAFRYDVGPVETNATVVLDLEFEVPADARLLELTGGDDRSTLASWNVELPLAAGELGQEGPRQAIGPVVAPPDRIPSPEGRIHETRAPGGASGSVLGAEFVVGQTVVTNAMLESLATPSGGARDAIGRTWAAVDLRIDSSLDAAWSLDASSIVLEDPAGRPHAVAMIFDDGDERSGTFRFDGPETFQLRVVFETAGLADDLSGWTLRVEPEDAIALELPLTGEVSAAWPRGLSAGASRNFSVGTFGGCTSTDGEEINATVTSAGLDVERRNVFDDLRRTAPDHRFLRVELDVANLVPAPAVFNSGTANCGESVLWPAFLVRADGRFLQELPVVDLVSVDYGAVERHAVTFEIPADTQVVELYGGVAPTLIAGWQLKDSVEVLTDFGATKADEQTLVTLDERVLFAFGSAELTDDAIAPLTRLAKVLLEDSVGEVVITGHTDSIGDDESNEQLSLDRAAAVVDFLVDAGIDANRLSAVGAGEAWPVAQNEHEDGSDDPIGRAMNRRVELLFTATA